MADKTVTEIIPGDSNLPALPAGSTPADMPLALRIWFDDALFARVKNIATYLSRAKGVTPPHLLGCPEACFFVVEKALIWNLSPSAVAAATYQTPGGKVGYEGKLCHAIVEQSGKLEPGTGGVRYELFGPWEHIDGKFEIGTSRKGNDYAKPTWTRADTKGVGVEVRCRLKGEKEDRVLRFFLEQAYPLNSTLWATDPKTQICYLAVRRFVSVVAPMLVMGVPFDGTDSLSDDEVSRANRATVVSPRAPDRNDFAGDQPTNGAPAAEPAVAEDPGAMAEGFAIILNDGSEVEAPDAKTYAEWLLKEATRQIADKDKLDGLWESNSPTFAKLPPEVAQTVREGWPTYQAKAEDGKAKAAGEKNLI